MISKGLGSLSIRLLAFSLSLVALSGCAVSQERLAKMTDLQVCANYGEMRTNMFSTGGEVESYRQEIEWRGLLTPEEWRLVEKKKIQQGMSVCALKASWGYSKDNRSVGSWGVHIQHIFKCDICSVPHAYVYSENGFVTGWSD